MLKILVVEDELYARESLVKQIRDYDAEQQLAVYQASNGEEALALYHKVRPELVMTDIRMPKMDGLTLLEKLRETDSKTQVVILSAYSDFEYARSALLNGASDYLLKPIEDEMLAACLDKIVRKSRSEKKEALITGRDIVTQFIFNSIRQESSPGFVEESMFRRVFPKWQIAALYFHGKKPEQEELLTAVETEYGDAFWTQLRFLEPEADIRMLVFVPGGETIFFWRRFLRLMSEKGYRMSVGISEVHHSEREIRSAYQEALDALKYKIYGAGVIFYEKVKNETYADYFLAKEKEEELRDALEDGNETRADELIRSIFSELAQAKTVKAECLELLYSRLSLLLLQALGESGRRGESLSRAREGVLRFECLAEMETFLNNICKNICRMGRHGTGRGRRDVVETMADYAREHYAEEVSVKILAEKVLFMNQDYLSHLFAEKKGISFSAYLRHIRMERAKELLEKEEYSVTEVASMTGYNDTSQFIRFFRQETGMTPRKYRIHRVERKDGNDSAEIE